MAFLFLYDLLIKVENLFQFHLTGSSVSKAIQSVFELVFLQRESLLVSFLCMLPLLFFGNHKLLRIPLFLVAFIHNLYLAFNRSFYQYFSVNYRQGVLEGQTTKLSVLISSIVGDINLMLILNLIILIGAAVALQRAWFHRPLRIPRPNRTVSYVFAALLIVILLYPVSSLYSLETHAWVDMARGFAKKPIAQLPLDEDPGLDVETPLYGKAPFLEASIRELLPQRPAELRSNGNGNGNGTKIKRKSKPVKPKNLLLIVLESVGSMQYLKDGAINPDVSPFLSSFNSHAIVFPNVYAPFPGTVRSHLSLQTGGYFITWGSVFDLLNYPLKVATLPSTVKESGYHAAVFSAQNLDGEQMLEMYRHLPFDLAFYPEMLSADIQKREQLNSWGIKETYAANAAVNWLKKTKSPFMLQYQSSATHHPYDYDGKGLSAPLENLWTHYKNSIRYTDKAVQSIVEYLMRVGKLRNTVIAITGDHGEAFGEYHSTNFAHKHHIYEENIRTFLVLIDMDVENGPHTSTVIGNTGNILPTLTHYLSGEEKSFPEQSFFTSTFKPRIQYFHKNSHPEKWGLRDGQWKFIAVKEVPKDFELYDLESDPTEQHNIANRHPEMLLEYERRASHWYVRKNKQYLQSAIDYDRDMHSLTLPDLATAGPKKVFFGVMNGGKFHPLPRINPSERLVAWAQTVAYGKETPIEFRFISPSNKSSVVRMLMQPEWTSVWVYLDHSEPLEVGNWKLELISANRVLLTSHFIVDAKAQPFKP